MACVSTLAMGLSFCGVGFGQVAPTDIAPVDIAPTNPAGRPAGENDPVEIRVRIAWGGGERAVWRGQIRIDQGEFVEPQCLGNEPDAWAMLTTQPQTIGIQSRGAQSYQALDLTVRAPVSSDMTIEMLSRTVGEEPQKITIPLAQLRDGSFNLPLDTAGNRMLVRRVPGDRLRVKMSRDHLVFSPGEAWPIEVQPWLIGRDGFNPKGLQARLVPARSEQVLWREEQKMERDAMGDWLALPLRVPVPDREGVYDLVLRATQPRGIPLLGTENPIYERRVQFVVIDPALPAAGASELAKSARSAKSAKAVAQSKLRGALAEPGSPDSGWEELFSFDASQARWWEKLTLPSLRQFSLTPMSMRGEGDARVARWGDRAASVLGGGKSQTYPLPILRVGQPHMVEVEYLGGNAATAGQALALSVLEPAANGSGRLQSIDAAIVSSAPLSGAIAAGPAQRLRLVFWPQTRNAQLLLTNLMSRESQTTDPQSASALPKQSPPVVGESEQVSNEVAFGRIRIYEGPDRLPPAGDRQADQGFRSVYAHCDDPRFYRDFSSSLALDAEANRELTDWQTFHESGQRMVDYLRHMGMGGLSLTCVADGASLAPLSSISGTPRFDTGRYFSTGQDTVSKDVLEMLLKMFDREDLRLQVGLRFTTPLVQLESYRAAGNAMGVELTNFRGESFRANSTDGETAYYNPLDPRVQQAMLDVVRELTTRYSRHKSFAGLRIDLDAKGFTQLPSLEWGCDPQTIALFIRDMAGELPPETGENLQPAQLLSGPLRPFWIAWRQRRMTNFYAAVAAEVRRLRPDVDVALHVAGLASDGAVAAASQPGSASRLTIERALAEMGIDVEGLAAVEGLTILHPHTVSRLLPLTEQGKSMQFAQNPIWDRSPVSSGHAAAITSDSPASVLATPNSGRLFGLPDSELQLRPRLAVEQHDFRRALNQALAVNDVHALTLGSESITTSTDSELANWIDVYRRLPAQPFTRFEPDGRENREGKEGAADGHPVSVATLSIAGRTYLYAVNQSPWPVTTSVVIAADAKGECRFGNLGASGDSRWERLTTAGNPRWRWELKLKPFQLVAQVLTNPAAQVVGVDSQIPADVIPQLQQRLVDVTSRLNVVKSPIVYNQVGNAGFDLVPPAVEIPGWHWNREPQVAVARDTLIRHDGIASLRIESAGPVAWVRSEPIRVPRSGRLAVQAMLRLEPLVQGQGQGQRQVPPLRLAIEGTYQGQPYYRFAEVAAPAPLPGESPRRPNNIPAVAAGARQPAKVPADPQATTTPQPLRTSSARPLLPSRPPTDVDTSAPRWAPFMLQVNDLPAGLEELQVRFDLMGAGRVWVDDVRLFELSMTADEQLEVSKIIGLADFQLRSGHPADCAATLDRYWPLFLKEFVTLPERRPVPSPPEIPGTAVQPNSPRPTRRRVAPRTGLLKRLQGLLPR